MSSNLERITCNSAHGNSKCDQEAVWFYTHVWNDEYIYLRCEYHRIRAAGVEWNINTDGWRVLTLEEALCFQVLKE